jgi:hypothetical protein
MNCRKTSKTVKVQLLRQHHRNRKEISWTVAIINNSDIFLHNMRILQHDYFLVQMATKGLFKHNLFNTR